MQLPFSVAFEPPTRSDLHAVVRTWWVWLIVAGILAATVMAYALSLEQKPAPGNGGGATIRIDSVPSGASVFLDGQERGHTPLSLQVPHGDHVVVLKKEGYADAVRHMAGAPGRSRNLRMKLWLRTPRAEALRSPLPGASVTDASFLSDGRVVVVIALPPDGSRQGWLREKDGSVHRIGPAEVRAHALAVAPDGERIAYLARSASTDFLPASATEVWVWNRAGSRRVYTAHGDSEQLLNVAWAPNGLDLLAVSRLTLGSGGSRTRLLMLSVNDHSERELIHLPAEVIPGSYNWSPSGKQLAFLTRANGTTLLCLLSTDGSGFRYLADVASGEGVAFASVAWSPDGTRIVYSAQDVSSRSNATSVLFTLDLSGSSSTVLATGGHSPAWLGNAILALAPSKGNKPVVLRQYGPNGQSRDLGELPIDAGNQFSVRWDILRARAILAAPHPSGFGTDRLQFWLLDWRDEEDQR